MALEGDDADEDDGSRTTESASRNSCSATMSHATRQTSEISTLAAAQSGDGGVGDGGRWGMRPKTTSVAENALAESPSVLPRLGLLAAYKPTVAATAPVAAVLSRRGVDR